MKKLSILLIAFLAINSAMAQGCLPEGITFTTQVQIDNFQTNYPGCTEIEGDVGIIGNRAVDNITNLNGLSVINSIQGDLWIEDNIDLLNLTGLEGLTSISGNLYLFYNIYLSNLDGFENLNYIGGNLWIEGNSMLENISGLDNINVASIYNLNIFNNHSLSSCDIQSICSYLSSPNGTVTISNNAEGCNSPSEIAELCGFTMPCLPFGNYYFFTQNEIDNFSSNYPGCIDLQGNVSISGTEITNLNGLNTITSIYGSLYIGASNLTSLTGLENLDHVYGHLIIEGAQELENLIGLNNLNYISGILGIHYNDSIKSLDGLENLDSVGWSISINDNPFLNNLNGLSNIKSINGYLEVINNDLLENLSGMDSINSLSIWGLDIENNFSLSTCEVKSICDYISNPNGEIIINNNAPGCNSREEVEAACLVGIENIIQENKLSIFPNPSSSSFTIQFTLENKEEVKLAVMNSLGQVVEIVANETLQSGNHAFNWNAEGMPAGMYFYQIQIGSQAGTGKMVLMK